MSIKDMRKAKGMTQKELADLVGADTRWVQKLEAGEIKLENVTVLKVLKLIWALTPYDDEQQIAQNMIMITKRILRENA